MLELKTLITISKVSCCRQDNLNPARAHAVLSVGSLNNGGLGVGKVLSARVGFRLWQGSMSLDSSVSTFLESLLCVRVFVCSQDKVLMNLFFCTGGIALLILHTGICLTRGIQEHSVHSPHFTNREVKAEGQMRGRLCLGGVGIYLCFLLWILCPHSAFAS